MILVTTVILVAVGILYSQRNAHGYTTETPGKSRTYTNGYGYFTVTGQSGTSTMQILFQCSGLGSSVTQGTFNNKSRKVTMSVKSGGGGAYNLKLATSSANTYKNANGNYTVMDLKISYTVPAHQQESGQTVDSPNAYDVKATSGTTGHSASERTITRTIQVSAYAIGLSTHTDQHIRTFNSRRTFTQKKNNYTLFYNANGGSVSTASKTVACGGTYGTLPSAWRTGYSLKGWNNQSNGSGSWANSSWMVCSGNHTVYAIWTPKQYTIAYDGNGADSGSMQSTTATYDANVTLAGNGFTKKGYAFLGWSTNAGATSAAYTNGQTFPWKQDGNMTLYAVWSKDNYEVELYGNGASGAKRTEIIKYGQASALPKNKFERSGYTFLGWCTKEDALLPEYTDEQAVTNLCDAGDTCSLYAVWKKTDGSFDLTNIIHDEGMFNGSVELKGQNGTEFLREWVDSTYARIDKPNAPGYFSSRY